MTTKWTQTHAQMSNVYVPQGTDGDWDCVASCVSIIRSLLGYKTPLPPRILKPGEQDVGISIPHIVSVAPKLFWRHRATVKVWCHEGFFAPRETAPNHWGGRILYPDDTYSERERYIFMFDYKTWGSYHEKGTTSHTVVGFPAFADGMWYNYIIRVTVP